jgi:hypothetical protein
MILGVTALAGKISRARQAPVYYTINGYFAGGPGPYCDIGGDAVTVYTATNVGDINGAHGTSATIYQDTLLTIVADNGSYSDESGGAGGAKYYEWQDGGWQGEIQSCP